MIFTSIQDAVPRLQLYNNHDPIAPKEWYVGMMLSTEPTKQIAICHVPKSSSTTWMNAFGSMNHIPIGSVKTYREVISPNISIHATTYYDMKLLNELPQFKFIFVRHPFERLGSYFQIYYQIYHPDKIQKKWEKHVKSIARIEKLEQKELRLHQELADYEKRYMNKLEKDTKNETLFQRFVDFVVHNISMTNDTGPISQTHFWPYTDLCKVCLVSYEFIGHLETFDDDIEKLSVRFPENQVLKEMRNSKRLNCKSNCEGNDLGSRYAGDYKQLKKETIVRLYQIYKNDFEFGGYDYPYDYIEYGIP